MFCNAMKNIIIKALVVRQFFKHRNDVCVCREFQLNNIIHADVFVFVGHHLIKLFLFNQRRFIIWVAVIAPEIFQRDEGGACPIGFVVQDLIQTIRDELLACEHVSQQVFDRQTANNAVHRHLVLKANLIEQDFKFIALALQAGEKGDLVHWILNHPQLTIRD